MEAWEEISPIVGDIGVVASEASFSRFLLKRTDIASPSNVLDSGNGEARHGDQKDPVGRSLALNLSHRIAENSGSPESVLNGSVAVKPSRKGPTRSSSAGASHSSAKEVSPETNGMEARMERRDLRNGGRLVRSRSPIEGVTENGSVEVRLKRPGIARVSDLEVFEDQAGSLKRPSRSRMLKSPSRKRGESQEVVQVLSMEPSKSTKSLEAKEPRKRSQSKSFDLRTSRGRGESPKDETTGQDDFKNVLTAILDDQRLTNGNSSETRISKSPRRSSHMESRDVNVDFLSKVSDAPVRSTRSLKVAAELPEDNLRAEASERRPKATRRHTRRKPDELASEDVPVSLDVDLQHPARLHKRKHQERRPRDVHNSSSFHSNNWVHLIEDVIMWKDVPRSTLYFGAGCFGIFSTSYVQNTNVGALTASCYTALVYLAGIYCHRSYLSGAQHSDELRWELSDSDVLESIKTLLPAVNLVIRKGRQFFCGDTFTTLKVAAFLWALAQLGYWISVWNFARLVFLAAFVVPKLLTSYSVQLQNQAEVVVERIWTAWEGYAHKKAALCGAFLLMWNFTSASTRIFGAFMILVTVRAYYGQLKVSDLQPAHSQLQEHLEDPMHEVEPSQEEQLPKSYPPLKDIKMEPA